MRQRKHECNASDTSAMQMRHDCNLIGKIAAGVKNVDFDNGTSENKRYFLKRFIFLLSKEFIILHFVNFFKKYTTDKNYKKLSLVILNI